MIENYNATCLRILQYAILFFNNFFLTKVYYTLNDFFLNKNRSFFFSLLHYFRVLVQAKIIVLKQESLSSSSNCPGRVNGIGLIRHLHDSVRDLRPFSLIILLFSAMFSISVWTAVPCSATISSFWPARRRTRRQKAFSFPVGT